MVAVKADLVWSPMLLLAHAYVQRLKRTLALTAGHTRVLHLDRAPEPISLHTETNGSQPLGTFPRAVSR